MTHDEQAWSGDEPTLTDADGRSRRGVLGGLIVGGAAVAGALAGGGVAAATSGGGWKRQQVRFDVASLGATWRDVVPRNPADDADFRGAFLIEGIMYPPDTVSDGFVPTPDGSIGRWFCQGWIIIDGNRLEPHISSTQKYMFGPLSEQKLFPADQLISEGLEGTFDPTQPPTRPIVGGTGRYLGATGSLVQEDRGANTTVLDDGTGDNAFNFAYTVDLLLPDV